VNSVKVTEAASPVSIFSVLILLGALLVGIIIGVFSITYVIVLAGALALAIILLLRLHECLLALIVAAHILIDSYMGYAPYQIALIMAVLLLIVCYLGRSVDRPWTEPRLFWLWIAFIVLTIVPTIKGGDFSLINSIGRYLEIVISPFIMFWLGNIIARDVAAIRRIFQWLAIMAALFSIHTIIETTTGVFLFESAKAKADLLQVGNFQLQEGISRAGSFFGNPNGNGIFLATCIFLPIGLFIESKNFWAKILYIVEMLLILPALMFTYSTGSWLATFVGVLVFMLLVGRVRYSLLLLLVVVALGVIALTIFPTQISAQLAHARDQGDFSLHVGDWLTALQVIQAYPIFGVGLGSQAYLVRAEPYRVSMQYKPLAEPDNSYLQWGATAGIPTMLVFLFMLGSVFWLAWQNWLHAETRYRVLFAAGIAALIALSVNSMSVDGWTSPLDVQFLGWLIAGVLTTPLLGRRLHHQPASSLAEATEASRVQVEAWIHNVKQGSVL
jgi:O-antigen ligase